VAETVVAATANAHKLEEMRSILGAAIELIARPGHVADVVEDAPTFVGNARLKANAIVAATGRPALADDSGLEVGFLAGAPGVHSARFAGDHPDDAANRALLLERLEGCTDRRARFRTVFVLAYPGGDEIVVEGTCTGVIADEERGSGGFGYDSIFVPDLGDGRTFAEHSPSEKNAISHRSQACRALLEALAQRQ
jgi:XTP/dITP diphosphohydrolase